MRKINLLNTNSSTFIKNSIFYIFIILFVFLVIEVFWEQKYFSDYVFQEWLVNYSQGFVRRGLPGTFFMFLQKQYNVDLYKTIKYFSYLTFLLFSTIYIFKVKSSKKILDWEALMVILFLPSLVLLPINDLGVIGRKEFFFFFGLLINLFFLEKNLRILKTNREQEYDYISNQISVEPINKYCYSLFICYNLLSIPAALSHEAIIFLALPLNMMITLNFISLTFSRKQVLLRTLIIYLPTILVSFACIIFKGNNTIALGICHSWLEYKDIYSNLPDNCSNEMPNVLKFFGTSIKDAIREVWSINIIAQRWVFLSWLLAFCVNIVILMRISSKILINSVENLKQKIYEPQESNFPVPVNIVTSFSFKYAFVPFIFSFILYIIALDWGRWFFIISITYTLCLLSPGLIRLEIASYHQNEWILKFFSPIYTTYSKVVSYLYNQYLLQRFSTIYFLVLIYALFVLRIVHWDMKVEDLHSHSLSENWIRYLRQ